MRLSVRLYAASLSPSLDLGEVPEPDALTPTEVALVASRLIDEAGLELFELSVWRQFGREG